MKIKHFLKPLFFLFISIILTNCSSEENEIEIIPTSFNTSNDFNYFINHNNTVKIYLKGTFKDGNDLADVTDRGFVYGKSSNPIPNGNNTVVAAGPADNITGIVDNLQKETTYYIRGYFKLSDNTYFYGNEIKINTSIDASESRSINMIIKPKLFFKNSEGITPELEVISIEKESPKEIGFEYSVNEDFSNSSIALDTDVSGNIFKNIYTEFIEELTPETTYYFRPYAKYNDGSVTNGGTSVASFKTNKAF
ncbi:hypothetical protein NH341_11030 [Tenacibaculum sp. XPcli2-G]|uniref:hypothetical protein n=1 Tax=Tenacibaculum sp. XPcli2-G TaxID=2954503 RepID=UPI0020974348|nr:hypothetical protein [Tenacibaculum sp. XPcli2-G]MCO7185962.1 hypothetical protein [Tenacibaculum sp. XPcli2-G]